jgi:cytochrome c5
MYENNKVLAEQGPCCLSWENIMGKRIGVLIIAGLLTAFLCAACSETDKTEPPEKVREEARPEEEKPAEKGEETAEKPLDGKAVLQARCTRCHGLDKIEKHAKVDREHWAKTVDAMIKKGAKLTEEERSTLLDYLAN